MKRKMNGTVGCTWGTLNRVARRETTEGSGVLRRFRGLPPRCTLELRRIEGALMLLRDQVIWF